MGASAVEPRSDSVWFDRTWERFRALVNTREPLPAPPEFLAVQDRFLQGLIAQAGITDAATLPPCPADPRLALWRGDITRLAADAIVNAANSGMLGCWIPGHHCIDNAIHTYAGVQLRLECARLMREQGCEEPTGRAKATPAFNLPARMIIHTVGPIANGSPTAAHRTQLAQCYRSCLDAAAQHACRTIAFLLHQHRRVRLPAARGGAYRGRHRARLARRAAGPPPNGRAKRQNPARPPLARRVRRVRRRRREHLPRASWPLKHQRKL